VGPTPPCGEFIAFDLTIRSNEGVFLDAFGVKVGAPVTTVTRQDSADTPKPIPDVRTPPTISTIAVTAPDSVARVRVGIDIAHTWDTDLDIWLVGPNGVRVELSTDNGSSNDDYTETWFDDAATTPITSGTAPFTGSFKPEGTLSTLNGTPAGGNWKLEITDDSGGDSGTLLGWSLDLTTVSPDRCTDCVTAAPGQVPESVAWAPGTRDTLFWDPVPDATSYRIYQGSEATLAALLTPAEDSCLAVTTLVAGTGPLLAGVPAPGGLDWYLVRAANAAGEGPAGSGTAGPRDQGSSGPCP
jgi:subtilisin-like proprotein convertase family protein